MVRRWALKSTLVVLQGGGQGSRLSGGGGSMVKGGGRGEQKRRVGGRRMMGLSESGVGDEDLTMVMMIIELPSWS